MEILKIFVLGQFLGLLLLASNHYSIVTAQTLFCVGGTFRRNNTEAWNRIIEAAGGKDNARFAVIAPGSEPNPMAVGMFVVDIFINDYGVKNVTYVDIRAGNGLAQDPATADLIRSMTGIYLCGGDKQIIAYTLMVDGKDSRVLGAIREVLDGGGVLAGTSAGCQTQTGSVLVNHGDSYEGLLYGAFEETGMYPMYPNNILTYDPNGGLNFFEGYIVDGHFSERGRESRLIRAVQQTKNVVGTGTPLALAPDEDVLLVITGFKEARLIAEVVGAGLSQHSGVTVVDASRVRENPSNTTDYENVSYSFITVGDKIDLTTGEIIFAPWKTDLRGNEELESASATDDILSISRRYAWQETARDLMNNKKNDVLINFTMQNDPTRFEVTFDRRTADRVGGIRPGGPETGFFVSYRNMTVTIKPTNN